jgi:hypothetical protein
MHRRLDNIFVSLSRLLTVEGKGKVCPVLFFLTEHHAMKAYWEMEVQLQTFLTSALDGSE